MAIWHDLVDDHGFTARYASVRRFRPGTARRGGARGTRRDHHGPRRGSSGRLRRWPDGAPSTDRQYRRTKMAPIDLVSALVADELRRRQDRLLERRHKLARFRDPERSRDTFDLISRRR
jgi:hypothetical protein